MTNDIKLIAWFAGLFEGEGSIVVYKGRPKTMCLTSTDLDVLQKIKDNFGGTIRKNRRNSQKSHWKDAYIWNLVPDEAIKLVVLILPYLMSRRKQQCDNFMTAYFEREVRRKLLDDKFLKILDLRKQGLTHKQIAEQSGYERSSVSKILKMNMVFEALR